jgi:hypothetical protein
MVGAGRAVTIPGATVRAQNTRKLAQPTTIELQVLDVT